MLLGQHCSWLSTILNNIVEPEEVRNKQGRKSGGVWGVVHPQTYISVDLQMSAVGLKI